VIEVREADLGRAEDAAMVLERVDAYSRDAWGDAAPLSDYARANLIAGLRAQPLALVAVALVDGAPAGIAVCFGGFSTFAAKPLINVHDLAVRAEFRGLGVSRALLEFVEERARERGCCKLTLEVLEANERARSVYEGAGFKVPVYGGKPTPSLFLTKSLEL
jgi:GNAT superfamily N-acetyltransferase